MVWNKHPSCCYTLGGGGGEEELGHLVHVYGKGERNKVLTVF